MVHQIMINAPKHRSLNACEKRVYQMLREGMNDKEIASTLRINRKAYYDTNADCPALSVESIITSIREKGWEIPKNNDIKEENGMAKGQRVPEEAVRKITAWVAEGKNTAQIAKALELPYTTVFNIIDRTKKELATEATATSTKENIPDVSLAELTEVVNPAKRLVAEILERELENRSLDLDAKERELIDKLRDVDELKEEYDRMSAEYKLIYGEWEGVNG